MGQTKKIFLAGFFIFAFFAAGAYYYFNKRASSAPPVLISSDKNKENMPGLGEEFRLRRDEVFHLRNSDLTLKIVKFINSPCPKGAYCFWSGLSVHVETEYQQKKHEVVLGPASNIGIKIEESPFVIFLKNSDYENYASFVVDLAEK